VVDDGDGLVGTAAPFSLALALPGRPAVWWDMLALHVEHDRNGASATRSTAGA
jgi:hypothetical protein